MIQNDPLLSHSQVYRLVDSRNSADFGQLREESVKAPAGCDNAGVVSSVGPGIAAGNGASRWSGAVFLPV
jgi:hypothetical protein